MSMEDEPGNWPSIMAMQFLVLYREIFKDLIAHYPERQKALTRDLSTIEKRFNAEGLSFLTKTLPKFAKALEYTLAGKGPFKCSSFHKEGHLGIPAFLRCFLDSIVSKKDGVLLPDDQVSAGAVLEIRQVCYLLYKLEVPYEDTVVESKVASFIETDHNLPLHFDHVDEGAQDVLRRANYLLRTLFKDFSLGDLKPKHGPGAVAGGEEQWEKSHFKTFYHQINREFPIRSYYFASPRHLVDDLDRFLELERKESGTSRLEAVPKDSRGPRLIAIEPAEYMFIQQAIKGKLYEFLEKHPFTKGHINFKDQTINRALALEASIKKNYATLDLKDASDRVSLALVKELFKQTPLLPALLATRTEEVQLPGKSLLTYRKFAPMGSALCFPIQALCYWSIAVACAWQAFGMKPLQTMKKTFVYGDDIIIPTFLSKLVTENLEKFGFKINREKSCDAGIFRESCGCDAVLGVDVTPIKIKRFSPNPEGLLSVIACSNNFYKRAYYHLSEELVRYVSSVVGKLPSTDEDDTPACFLYTRTGPRFYGLKTRFNEDLQRFEIRTWVPHSRHISLSDEDDWCRVLDTFLQGSTQHGPRIGVKRRSTSLRKQWVRCTMHQAA